VADIILFHHVQGLTPGVAAFADALAGDGHTVHTPDLFDGHVFGRMADGFAYLKSLDPNQVREQIEVVVDALPSNLVFAGMSWGVSHAQRLAQTTPGARGALFFDACFPVTGEDAFAPWPDGLSAQIHGMDQDEFFALEGDLDAARELASIAGPDQVEVFTYSGDSHLFADSSLPSYDPVATEVALSRVRSFLARVF
jgi:dienelactone hydrolase